MKATITLFDGTTIALEEFHHYEVNGGTVIDFLDEQGRLLAFVNKNHFVHATRFQEGDK